MVRVSCFTFAITFAAGLLVGVIPAVRFATTSPAAAAALLDDGRRTAGRPAAFAPCSWAPKSRAASSASSSRRYS